ncbi:hypothetical protein CR513_50944, partial [Mucuna pruriens]
MEERKVGVKNTLKAVTVFCLFPDNIKDGVNQLSPLGVVTLGPVVSGARLPEYKVIRPKNLTVRTRSNTVHGPGLQIHEHCPGNESTATRFIVVHVDSLELQLVVPLVPSCRVDPVLRAHHLPELRSDLVPALPSLDVKNLTHLRDSASFTKDE